MDKDNILELLKKSRDTGMQFLFEKYKILPLISTIAVASLVIFSLNPNLIKNWLLFKISLTILVINIPASLFIFLCVVNLEIGELIRQMKTLDYYSMPEITIIGRIKKAYTKKGLNGATKEIFKIVCIHSAWLLTGVLATGLIIFLFSLK